MSFEVTVIIKLPHISQSWRCILSLRELISDTDIISCLQGGALPLFRDLFQALGHSSGVVVSFLSR